MKHIHSQSLKEYVGQTWCQLVLYFSSLYYNYINLYNIYYIGGLVVAEIDVFYRNSSRLCVGRMCILTNTVEQTVNLLSLPVHFI